MARALVDALIGRLLGEICPSCAGRTDAGFCEGCAAELPRIAGACRACGLAHPAGAACPALAAEWRVARVLAPFSYAAPLDRFVRALKYHGARELGRAFGLLLAAEARREPPTAEALVPVPLHPHRLRERGYNQATEIARTLGEELSLPVLVRGVHRLREAGQQAGQTAGRRRANVAAAFAARRGLRGRAIAIVDDVITTGATVNALAAALLAAGARSCEAWAIARTPPRDASSVT